MATANAAGQGETVASVRDRLFLIAERQAGAAGLEAISVRDVAHEAQASLSAIAYHFGSKNGLLAAILKTRLAEIDAWREPQLSALEALPVPPLRRVLWALFEPMIRWTLGPDARPDTVQFLCRAQAVPIPELQAIWDASASQLERVIQLMVRAMPDMPLAEVLWRAHFCLGLEHMTPWDLRRLAVVSDGLCVPRDADELLGRMVDFAMAAMRVPANS